MVYIVHPVASFFFYWILHYYFSCIDQAAISVKLGSYGYWTLLHGT